MKPIKKEALKKEVKEEKKKEPKKPEVPADAVTKELFEKTAKGFTKWITEKVGEVVDGAVKNAFGDPNAGEELPERQNLAEGSESPIAKAIQAAVKKSVSKTIEK